MYKTNAKVIKITLFTDFKAKLICVIYLLKSYKRTKDRSVKTKSGGSAAMSEREQASELKAPNLLHNSMRNESFTK